MAGEHVPVLLDEVLNALKIRPDAVYLDATYGRGGHSAAILERLGGEGRLIVIDRDPAAIQVACERHAGDARVITEQGNFSELGAIVEKHAMQGSIAGALFDLGVSSPQLDAPARGFSFLRDGPLDMRMNPTAGDSAAEWLRRVSERELYAVLRRLGEERHASGIAKAIVRAREAGPIATTGELARIVTGVVAARPGRVHPATRTFQAIRIAVNDELGELTRALDQVLALLGIGGRLAVISFHSLEDRIVKRFIRVQSRIAEPYRGLPEIPLHARPVLRAIGRVIRAAEAEVASNPRSRSARLRVAEKIR